MSLLVILALIIIAITLIGEAIGRYSWSRMNHALISLLSLTFGVLWLYLIG